MGDDNDLNIGMIMILLVCPLLHLIGAILALVGVIKSIMPLAMIGIIINLLTVSVYMIMYFIPIIIDEINARYLGKKWHEAYLERKKQEKENKTYKKTKRKKGITGRR